LSNNLVDVRDRESFLATVVSMTSALWRGVAYQ
jgi:hypothetical protein